MPRLPGAQDGLHGPQRLSCAEAVHARGRGSPEPPGTGAQTGVPGRSFVTNEPAYMHVRGMLDNQAYEAAMRDRDWERGKDDHGFGLLLEQSPRLNRLTVQWHNAVRQMFSPRSHAAVCFAPLAMVFLAPEGTAACCDTWDTGLGGTAPLILGNSIPAPPAFYSYNLFKILTSINSYAPNCITGCGWFELNMMNPIRKWASELTDRYMDNTITLGQMWNEMLDYFSLSPETPMPELPLFSLAGEVAQSA